MALELMLMWVAVILYAVSSIGFIIGAVFKASRMLFISMLVAGIGFAFHAVAIALRWIEVGHGPYLGFYEAVSAFVWFGLAGYFAIVLYRRSLNVVGVVALPLSFIMLGFAMFVPKSPLPITPSLASVWLIVHVVFATISYTALFISFALGIVYIVRERQLGDAESGPEPNEPAKQAKGLFSNLPKQHVLDNLIFKLVAVGFILWTIMIVTGAIWANEAWGRYWGWDSIETWSLIVWIVYAIVLHLRLTMGYTGKKFAWCAIIAMPVMLFSLVGVPLLYNSIHSAYLDFSG